MAQKNDILWKGILEVVFDDFLRFVFPEAEQVFDMKRTFEFLDKELAKMYPDPEKSSTTRLVDKLVKVFRTDGEEQWLLVHVEVQGHSDPLFAERMFQYYYRILDRYQRPVTAIAIFTGAGGRSMPNYYEYDFLGTYHLYRYNTFCLLDYPDKVLSTSDNPFALVALAAKMALLKGKIPEVELKDRKLLIAKLLLNKGAFPRKKIDAILTFLNNYIQFEKPETNRIFIEQLDQITGKRKTMDIFEQVAEIRKEEGKEEGREEVQLYVVKKLLSDTEFSSEKIASIVGVTTSFVEEIRQGKK